MEIRIASPSTAELKRLRRKVEDLDDWPCGIPALEAVALAVVLRAECGRLWVRVERDPDLRVIAPDGPPAVGRQQLRVLAAREAVRRAAGLPARPMEQGTLWPRAAQGEHAGWDDVVHELASCFYGFMRYVRMLAAALEEDGWLIPSQMDMAAKLYVATRESVEKGEMVVDDDYQGSSLE